MKSNKIIAIHSFPVWLPQTQTWMYNQVKHLPETVEVHVVCERTENLDQFAVSNIHSLQSTSKLQYYLEKGMRKLRLRRLPSYLTLMAQKTNGQLIHSHFGDIGWLNLDAVRRADVRHVVTFYGYDVNRLPTQDRNWLSRYKELFERADLFLCEGPHMAQQLRRIGCRPEKIRVHHLGVEIETIPYKPRSWQHGQPLRVLIASSFQEKKGIPYALEALAVLQHDLPMEITIIGDAGSQQRSQREKRYILDIIEDRGLATKTKLLGFQPYSILFREAYDHHVFISPSVTASDGDTEGGAPVSIIEMIATGMPVVSTSHCDIPEVVQYGITNWLVEERNVNGLVNKMRWLVEHSNEWNEYLDRGRRHVELEFSANEQGKRLEKIYQSLMDEKSDPRS